jgi:hypothetical protein
VAARQRKKIRQPLRHGDRLFLVKYMRLHWLALTSENVNLADAEWLFKPD